MTVKRVLLIRHGETDWNHVGRWQGQEQISLNESGLAQARKLAHYLREHETVSAIYSSDLLRALQTAESIAMPFGLTPKPDSRLREHHLGVFQGLTREEIKLKYAVEFAAMFSDQMGYQIPSGESRLQLQERAYSAWQSAVQEAAGEQVAIVSHGGTIKVLLMKLFENNPDLVTIRFGNTSISTVERIGQTWRLVSLNVTPHLPHEDAVDRYPGGRPDELGSGEGRSHSDGLNNTTSEQL